MKKAQLSILLFTLLVLILTSCGEHTHEWTEWKTLNSATCTENGLEERACNSCDEVETNVIEATGHSFGEWKTLISSTCTTKGIEERNCTSCDKVEKRETEDFGHDFDAWTVVSAATCTENGLEERACNFCDEVETIVTKALGHDTDIVWEWNGYTSAIAKAYCTRDCDYSKEYTATITTTSTSDKTIYTATVTIGGRVYTDVKEEVLVAEVDDFKYELVDDSYITITEYIGDEAEVVIPSYITLDGIDFPVSEIGNSAFYGKSFVTDVEIPDTVTIIGEKAFGNCFSLTSINIPDSVTTIEYMAFVHCHRLTSAVIGDGVVTIGPSAFSFCNSLSSVVLGNNVSIIDANAFRECVSLTSLDIPDSVSVIGYSAFRGCNRLASVVIGNGVSIINALAFYDCLILDEITMGDNVDSIGEDAFFGCDNISCVYINDITNWCNIIFTYGDSNPLSYADNLYINGELVSELVIPDDITSIGAYAFNYCENLINVVISDSVTSIGDYAFSDCYNITSVELGNNVTYIGCDAFSSCDSLNDIVIPDSVITIDEGAFWGCSGITSVVIGDSVTSIGDCAFSGCYGLTNVVIGDSVTSIGERAFESCDLQSIVIPDSVISIGNYAFQYCYSLASVDMGRKVTSIGDMAFYYCNITDVYINDLASWAGIDFGILSNPARNADNIYIDGKLITTDLIIPDNVTRIGNYAFYGFNIVNLVVSDSVTIIGERAFAECQNLNSVTIGKGINTIGDYAFEGCKNITSIEIQGEVSVIGSKVFDSCRKVENVSASANACQYIPCNSLKSMTIKSGIIEDYSFSSYYTELTSMTICEGVTSIGIDAFRNCYNLTEIEIDDSVTYAGEGAFENCTNITQAKIPAVVISSIPKESLTYVTVTSGDIGDYAFSYCTNLTEVVIMYDVSSVSDSAFNDCCGITYASIPAFAINSIPKNSLERVVITLGKSGNIIENRAFDNCDSIESVTIMDDIFVVSTAFEGCDNIKFAEIPASAINSIPKISLEHIVITSGNIGDQAFAGYSNLQRVEIKSNDTSIGSYAFKDCSSLISIEVTENHEKYKTKDGNLYKKDGTTLVQYAIGKQETALSIPANVIHIGPYAFASCSSLELVWIINNVTEIGDHAFTDCKKLRDVTIGDKVTTIGFAAFKGCSSLTNVEIGSGVEEIGGQAFYKCTSLSRIVIPGSVETIGEYAFQLCGELDYVVINEGVTTIKESAFAHCGKLSSIVIPGSIKTIGKSAFQHCSELANVVINEGVTTISESAFASCGSLCSIEIPSSVKSIEKGAFDSCSSLYDVVIKESKNTSCYNDCFSNCEKLTKVYYRGTAEVWKLNTINSAHSPALNNPYFYSKDYPTSCFGNYWYYNEKNGAKVIWNMDVQAFIAQEYSKEYLDSLLLDGKRIYSENLYEAYRGDGKFQDQLKQWEVENIEDLSSWVNKKLAKKDLYKMVLFDLLVGVSNDHTREKNAVEKYFESYYSDVIMCILESSDGVVTDNLQIIELIVQECGDIEEARYKCALYQTFYTMGKNYKKMLHSIACDESLPEELREAATELIICFGDVTKDGLDKIMKNDEKLREMGQIVSFIVDNVWNGILTSVFPSIDLATLPIKGLKFIEEKICDYEARIDSYYQLGAHTAIQNALRNIIQEKTNSGIDYLNMQNKAEVEYYLYIVDMYKSSIKMSFEHARIIISGNYNIWTEIKYQDWLENLNKEETTITTEFDDMYNNAYSEYKKYKNIR